MGFLNVIFRHPLKDACYMQAKGNMLHEFVSDSQYLALSQQLEFVMLQIFQDEV
jgi:hypothetical protein